VFLLVSVVVVTVCAEDIVSPVAAQMDIPDITALQAEFIQTKHIALLRHRAVITGELCIEKENGRMAWHVASPIRYSCVITDESLTQWDIDSNQQITLSADRYPWLKILSRNMKDWFSGNFRSMSSEFTVKTDGKHEKIMTARPDSRIAEFIKSIEFHFSDDGSAISRVIFTEVNGDTTDIAFSNIRINQPIPAEKWKVKPN
jgi:outer membrane lipoprotein-sorting protein